jgi:hypothetical protein
VAGGVYWRQRHALKRGYASMSPLIPHCIANPKMPACQCLRFIKRSKTHAQFGGQDLGLVGFAPIYLNGLLAIFFVFVLPGLVFVRFFDIPSFPQRWFVVFLSSLTANHLFVTLIAALHINPLYAYRAATAVLIAILVFARLKEITGSTTPIWRGRSIVLRSDLGWLLLSLAVLSLAYINVWKHGVPNIFEGGDVSVSWNVWALIWSQGLFPTASLGYPQFVPTIWAVTYIFTGSSEQYFAFYIYIVWLIVPIVLNAMILGRISRWHVLVPGFVFVWLVAEIQEPWLRSTLQEASPDWVAAIFLFCGVALFIANAPEGRFDREKIITALTSLCLVSIAAATKPIAGLFAIAVMVGICTDAARHLDRKARNWFFLVAGLLLSSFVIAYALNYSHLGGRSMPNYPVSELSDRLSNAVTRLKSNLTIPFRIMVFAGLVLAPFLPRIRWLALPLFIGFWLWANTASYDLRNLLGLLLISASIPLYALARRLPVKSAAASKSRWSVPDSAVAGGLAAMAVALTLTLAQGDAQLKARFATDQLRGGDGFELNQSIAKLLQRGCVIFSADGYIATISALQPFRGQMRFFFFTEP